MHLRVSALGGKLSATEFHFCNSFSVTRRGLPQQKLWCAVTPLFAPDAMAFLPSRHSFLSAHARARLNARFGPGAAPGIAAAHRFRALLMRLFRHQRSRLFRYVFAWIDAEQAGVVREASF